MTEAFPSRRVIHYRAGYKYQLSRDFFRPLPWYCGRTVRAGDFVLLTAATPEQDACLLVRAGYAWDGPSGPTIDTGNSLRAALLHDAGYQLEREHGLGFRANWDEEFHAMLLEDGMSRVRAWLWYHTVRPCAGYAARKGSDGGHPPLIAPAKVPEWWHAPNLPTG